MEMLLRRQYVAKESRNVTVINPLSHHAALYVSICFRLEEASTDEHGDVTMPFISVVKEMP
jgi:hypothetical protein